MPQPTNNPTLLDKLFRRSTSPLVAKIHSHAIGVPLLVHPSHGERLIGAFLHGAIDTPPPLRAAATAAAGGHRSGEGRRPEYLGRPRAPADA